MKMIMTMMTNDLYNDDSTTMTTMFTTAMSTTTAMMMMILNSDLRAKSSSYLHRITLNDRSLCLACNRYGIIHCMSIKLEKVPSSGADKNYFFLAVRNDR